MNARSVRSILGAALAALAIVSPASAQFGDLPRINAAAPGFQTGFGIPRINGGGFAGLRPAVLGGPFTVPSVQTGYLFGEFVPTDPLIRQIQIGPAPVGLLSGVDPNSGIAVAGVPGAGGRVVRAVGPVVQTPAGPAVRAVDAATGVEFLALVPSETPSAAVTNPGPLAAARVVKVNPDSVIVEREENGRTLTEILPPHRVYAAVRGGFVPAGSLRRLRPGAEVLVPLTGARGTIIVTRPGEFGTRASSASAASGR